MNLNVLDIDLSELLVFLKIALLVVVVLMIISIVYKGKIVKHTLSYIRSKSKNLGEYTNKNIDVYRYINNNNTLSYKLDLISYLELKYVYRSNINRHIKWFNIYYLFLISLLIYVFVFVSLNRFFQSPLPGMIIGTIFFLMPFITIELVCRRNSLAVRKQYTNFISYLNRWVSIDDNILFGMEKTLESGVGKPLEDYIRDFLNHVHIGMDINEALEVLRLKANNESFSVFIYNLQQVLKSRGDVATLIKNLEYEAYKIEEEYTRRKLSSYKERIIVNGTFVVVMFTAYYMLNNNPLIYDFYIGSSTGRYLMVIFSTFLFIAFIITINVSSFRE